MFNGIITNTGKIKNIITKNNNCSIKILSKLIFKKHDIGSSISCSGVCLTLENYNDNTLNFYLSKETLNKTIFKSSKKDDVINLERPIKFGDSMSGHFVQGHVDITSQVMKIVTLGKSRLINFKLAKKFKKYIVQKGSIAINGVSLTIAKITKDGFQISIVPHTLKLTNLVMLKEKHWVNVEFDILGKYIKNFKES